MSPFRSSLCTRRRCVGTLVALLFALMACSPLWVFAHFSAGDSVSAGDESAASNYRMILFDWVDGSRERKVPARLFWPSDASHESVPLVLFSHGIGSSDDGYTHLGRYWASHGIASLHVRHVGSDRSIWDGNPLQVLQRIERAAGEDEAINRAIDLRWALDKIVSGRFGTRIDSARIVVAGHSYGANTAMLLGQ